MAIVNKSIRQAGFRAGYDKRTRRHGSCVFRGLYGSAPFEEAVSRLGPNQLSSGIPALRRCSRQNCSTRGVASLLGSPLTLRDNPSSTKGTIVIDNKSTTFPQLQLDSLIDNFEAAWQDGSPVTILQHLTVDSTDERYVPLLVELVKVDLEYRWRFNSGRMTDSFPIRPRVEDYLQRFPALSDHEDVVLDLIGEEFRVARRNGESATTETYTHRFANYAGRLPTYLNRIKQECVFEVDETRFQPGNVEETRFEPAGLLAKQAQIAERARELMEDSIHDSDDESSCLEDSQFEIPEDNRECSDTHIAAMDDTQFEFQMLDAEADDRDSFKNDILALLNARPFCDLPATYQKDLVRDLEPFLTVREFEAGERIVVQGQVATELLMIMDGVAEVSIVDNQLWQRKTDTISRKSLVGLFSLFTGMQHLATVTATTKVRVLALCRRGYTKLFGTYPSLLTGFAECLSDELGHGEINALCNKTVNGFLIRRFISRGAMASVYEAKHVPTGRTVAIKMLHHHLAFETQTVARFLRESEALAAMQHENVVRYFCSFKSAKTMFIVMEYVEGQTLNEFIKERGAIPESTVRNVIGQLAKAVLHAHELGIIHRDLKPANIIIQKDGTVKLTDFGLAKTELSMSLTHFGQILGTPRYMPPEQLMGRSVDGAADFFAIGCMAYEMLTGAAPFHAEDTVALLREQLTWTIPERSEMPVEVSIPMYQLLHQSLRMEDSARTLDLLSIAAWSNE